MFRSRIQGDIAIITFNSCSLADPKDITNALSVGGRNTTKFILDFSGIKFFRNKDAVLKVILKNHNYFERLDGGIVIVFNKILNLSKMELAQMGIPVAQRIRKAVKAF